MRQKRHTFQIISIFVVREGNFANETTANRSHYRTPLSDIALWCNIYIMLNFIFGWGTPSVLEK